MGSADFSEKFQTFSSMIIEKVVKKQWKKQKMHEKSHKILQKSSQTTLEPSLYLHNDLG